MRREVVRAGACERAAVAAERGAHGVEHVSVSHAAQPNGDATLNAEVQVRGAHDTLCPRRRRAHRLSGRRRRPVDLVYVPPQLQQVEHLWAEPRVAAFFERLSRFSRLILLDRRGTGLSDPIATATTLEDQMEDVTAVLDAVGSEQAALFAQSEGAAMAMLYAATHPERTRALVLYAGMARITSAPGYEWPGPPQERRERIEQIFAHWGEGARIEQIAPSAVGDASLRRWFGRLERLSASPGALRLLFDIAGETDVRDVLPSIAAPTLVLHRREDQLIDIRHSRYLAEHIPGARFVELDGRDNLIVVGDSERVLAEVERVPHRHAHAARARAGARDRHVHRHRRLDRDGCAARRPCLARPARAPRRAQP